jgi:sugar diacid utilization regulator
MLTFLTICPSDETPVTCVVSTLARGLGDHPADRILDHVSVAKLAAQSLDDAMQSPIKRAVETRIVEQDDELQLVQRLFSRSTPDLEALKEEYRGVIDGLGWRLDVGLSAIAEGRDRAKRAEAEARALVSMAAPGHGSTRLFTRSDGSLHSLHLLRSATADFNRYTDHIRSALVAADPLLASTAAAYAQTECNASDTASRLGVDRRTINHRLHRIAELTGLDLPTFPAKIILYLAFLPEMRLE